MCERVSLTTVKEVITNTLLVINDFTKFAELVA